MSVFVFNFGIWLDFPRQIYMFIVLLEKNKQKHKIHSC